MPFTYEGLIEQIKQKEAGLMGIHLPVLSMHYYEFADQAGINTEEYYTIQSYIKNVSYEEKRTLFERLGFKVLYMTLYAVKVIHFVNGQVPQAPSNPTIDELFLDNKRNVFILEIEVGMDSLYFILEYEDEDALANYTVDREELAREKERQEKIRAIFGRNRNK